MRAKGMTMHCLSLFVWSVSMTACLSYNKIFLVVLQVADDDARSKAHEQFSKVQRAYDVLKVPKTRREYDSGMNVSES